MTNILEKNSGFSLIELLTTVFIIAFLFMLTIPSNRDWLVENRTVSAVNTLVSALNYARSEAISRNETIIFCHSVDHITCNGSWENGQIILNKMGHILRVFSALPATDKLIWNSSGGTDDKLQWQPTGFTNGQRGTFYYCASHASPTFSRNIVVLDTGRIYSSIMTTQEYAVYCAG